MKRAINLISATALFAGAVHAADVNVTLPITEDTTWTSDNEYHMNGFIFVQNNATLTIEAGTVIKAAAGSGNDATALIVSREGMINAVGFPSAPIVFTAEADPMDGSWGPEMGGSWGGLIILGNAPVNSNSTNTGTAPDIEGLIEGVPAFVGDLAKYGGNVSDDNSGILKYVSIRFSGSELADNSEINGLTLGAVGNGTTIDHVEIFACSDDAVEWFGGTVNAKNLVSAYGGDDGFDYDEGWEGKGQFWFHIAAEVANNDFEADNGGEHDGELNNQGGNIGGGTVYNATYLGNRTGGGFALRIRDNAYAVYKNSIFGGWSQAVRIEPDSGPRIGAANSPIDISNNIWYDFAGTTAADLAHGNTADTLGAGGTDIDDDESFLWSNAALSNSIEDPLLNGDSRGNLDGGNKFASVDGMLDPRPVSSSPALTNALADLPEGETFLQEVSYQGAFSKDHNWLDGWTYLSQAGFLAESQAPDGEVFNVSARAPLAVGQNLIPGFTILGTKTVLIRAVGAKLADFGVGTPMADPMMTLFKTSFDESPNELIATFDDWSEVNAVEIAATMAYIGLFPFTPGEFQGQDRPTDDTKSAAALVTLETGVYTVVVSSADGGEGEVLVDVTVVE